MSKSKDRKSLPLFPELFPFGGKLDENNRLNDVREWLVGNIKRLAKAAGKKYRTFRRTARKDYLNYSKKRTKTKKTIRKVKKQMLQYVRRNIKQLAEAIEIVKVQGEKVKEDILERLKVTEKIYHHQLEMYKKKVNRITDRVVSFRRPYVQPIKRGEMGKKVDLFNLLLQHELHRLSLDELVALVVALVELDHQGGPAPHRVSVRKRTQTTIAPTQVT